MKFQRKPLRDAIQKEILGRIIDGSLPSGQRINETRLAVDLGLSRTPLREAMLTLGASGILKSDMGKGFAVPSLDPVEMRQVLDMLAVLQPLALGRAMPLSPAQLLDISNHLSRARVRLGKQATGPEAGMALAGLVFNWSEGMLRDCPNAILKADINRLEGLAARYWFTAGARGMETKNLFDSFDGLYGLVRKGQKDQACQVWATHIQKFGDLAVQHLGL